MKRALLLLALLPAPAAAQVSWPCDAWPCLPDETLNLIAHDALHAVESVAVAEGLRLIDADWNETDRYLLATVALPVLQEVIDLAFVSERSLSDGPSDQSLMDIPTYQGAWLLPLLRDGKYWQAALVFVAWGGFIYWRSAGKP